LIKLQLTLHGLDFGIHAEMTNFLHLYETMSAGTWQLSSNFISNNYQGKGLQ